MRAVTHALIKSEMEWFKHSTDWTNDPMEIYNSALTDCQMKLDWFYAEHKDCPVTEEEYKELYELFSELFQRRPDRNTRNKERYEPYNLGIEHAIEALYRFMEKEIY